MSDFENIYKTYFSDVYRYSLSLTRDHVRAEDITEETFYRSLRSIGSFRGECEIRVWLCRIAKNIWLNEQKAASRFDGDTVAEEIAEDGDFTENIADKQTALEIHKILHDIEEPYKEVFSLRIFGELSFKDIAGLFGKNEHWACVTYHRAKEKIQNELMSGAK
ncbi:MAG: sigma-70 family RNA polymerase sigma factor [Eubacteriales bacterium]|nr:sigma-70 family RNA polymerase sigma factor [Eubacteriales bacterium]